jgi:hypothetical protein
MAKGGGGGGQFLAVAFTDENGNHKYNPGKDALIAGVQDTNHDKTVSVGDTIVFGTYPHLDGTQAGTFTQTSAGISGVIIGPGVLHVESGTNDLFWITPTSDAAHEVLDTDGVRIIDETERGLDEVHVSGVGQIGLPDTTPVNESLQQLGDQGFLDVLIFV